MENKPALPTRHVIVTASRSGSQSGRARLILRPSYSIVWQVFLASERRSLLRREERTGQSIGDEAFGLLSPVAAGFRFLRRPLVIERLGIRHN